MTTDYHEMYVGVVHGFFSVELQPGERENNEYSELMDSHRAAQWNPDYDDNNGVADLDQLNIAICMSGNGDGAATLSDRVR
jgi:hypothetical protein